MFWFLFYFVFPNYFQKQLVKLHEKLCMDFDWTSFALCITLGADTIHDYGITLIYLTS